jgi:hypothetical protein
LYCISLIQDIEGYDMIIEPSAGNGSFSSQIKNCIAYDIVPEAEHIIKQDFFKLEINKDKYNKILVLGNPPFGKRANLAVNFFNHAGIFATTIAFIVPLQFRKWSVQNKLNNKFHLLSDTNLPSESFIFNDKEISINCCFQIWTNQNISNNLRLKQKPILNHPDFEMWQYNNTKQALKYFDKQKYQWDFAVPRQGYYDYSLRVKEEKELNPKIQWIFFKAKNEEVLNRLLNLDFTKLSKNNTIIPGFGKADVIKEYSNV